MPGQTCNTAVLNKLLFLDLSRQMLSLGVLTDFNVSAAFDRVLAGLSIITCERVGLPRMVSQFMFMLLKDMNFHLITGFEKSLDSFCNLDNGDIGQRVLQGSSSAAPIYILTSDISLVTYIKCSIGGSFLHLTTKEIITDQVVQYVDDTSQFLNLMGICTDQKEYSKTEISETLYSATKKNLESWSECMWTSGGNLNVGKCFCYAFKPQLNYSTQRIKCKKITIPRALTLFNLGAGDTQCLLELPPTTLLLDVHLAFLFHLMVMEGPS